MDAPEFTLKLTPEGLMWRHEPSGRLLPVVRGGDGPNDTPAGDGNGGDGSGQGADGTGGGGDPEKTFTQADLDKYAVRRAAEAKRAAASDMAEQLGVSVEKAKEIIAAHNEAEAKNKTEAERLRDEAAAAKAEAEQTKADAAAEKFAAKVERKLAGAGVGKGLADDEAAKRMTRAVRLVNLAPDASDAEIDAEVEALKTEVPGLFDETASSGNGNGKPTAPSGTTTGGAPPKGGQAGKSALERGADRWAKKNPQNTAAAQA